jgi:hypothetical protein
MQYNEISFTYLPREKFTQFYQANIALLRAFMPDGGSLKNVSYSKIDPSYFIFDTGSAVGVARFDDEGQVTIIFSGQEPPECDVIEMVPADLAVTCY